MKPATPRQQKFAAAYDADIWPLVPERGADLILRHLPRIAAATVLDIGSATGRLALAVGERLDQKGRVVGIDPSPALIDRANAAKALSPAGGKVSFQCADLLPPWPGGNGAYDLIVSNLALADVPDQGAALSDGARILKPGGRLVATIPLRGSWAEFLDLYADVLTEQGKPDGLTALAAYKRSLPDVDVVTRWLESAGLTQIAIDVNRWELLFKSAREFFFAPIVELGPLPIWKQIAGGRGDEMQDVFFFVKEAIETYFSGAPFPVSMVVACLQGVKPIAAASP